jgi:hypothetical protein
MVHVIDLNFCSWMLKAAVADKLSTCNGILKGQSKFCPSESQGPNSFDQEDILGLHRSSEFTPLDDVSACFPLSI